MSITSITMNGNSPLTLSMRNALKSVCVATHSTNNILIKHVQYMLLGDT